MVDAAIRRWFTFRDYVDLEEISTVKHEYLDGQVWAMAGGTPTHAAVAANVIALLTLQLRGRRCRVFSSDLRIRVPATGLATYPDVSVVCNQLELEPHDPKGHTVINPTAIIEVLSPSTEAYDRTEKLAHYQQLPALTTVALIAHDAQRIDVWHRADGGWQERSFGAAESAPLASIDCELVVSEVYRDPLAD